MRAFPSATTLSGRNFAVPPQEDADPPPERLRGRSAAIPSLEQVQSLVRRQLVLDAVLAAAAFAFTLAAISRSANFDGDRDLDPPGAVLAALASWPLVARRITTIPVFAVVTAATSALYLAGYGLGPPVAFALALFTLADRRDQTQPWARRAALFGSVVVLLGPHLVRGDFLPQLLLGSAFWAAAWFAGDRARLRRERLSELEERARRAEREAERERRLAAAEERTRIARDLHDSAGHAINVILVQAGAARLLQEQNPQQAREALETIEEVARDTLGEIDQLVRALRDDGAAPEIEPPGLAALGMLAERHRSSGLEVTVNVEGSRRPLPPGVDQAAYRILQEALTNAARHGRGEAEVRVAFGANAIDLTVTNPAPPGARAAAAGHGIVGMRERASLLGGGLEAEASDGVFRVRARLPYGADGEPG
jgi:signal transduction histidine kinase